MDENPISVQQIFFQHVKERLPAHLSLVDEIAELLNISNDSAYRRIRGEKALSFEEIRNLCSHFKISLDQLFHLETDTILFSGRFINANNFDFDRYLQDILGMLVYTNSFERKELFVMSKDIPLLHFFNFPELTAFKSFFWMKTILQYPLYNKKRLAVDEISPSVLQTGARIIEEYNKLPSQEIWHIDSINATLGQIEYYKATRIFATDQDTARVYDGLQKTIDHIEMQAEAGIKFSPQAPPLSKKAPLKFYINEFVLGDNSYLLHLNEGRMVILNHSVLNIIRTKDDYFTRCTDEHYQNIIRKSNPIGGVNEKERSKFFNLLRERIEISRKR